MNIAIVLCILFGATYLVSHLTDIHHTPPAELYFDMHTHPTSLPCSKTILPCQSDRDCLLGCEEESVKCYKGKCIAPQATYACHKQHGGLEVLSLNLLNELQFQCICLYPHFYQGPACETQNPHVCQNGLLLMDLSREKLPNLVKCLCPADHLQKELYRHAIAYPICVPQTAAWIEKYQ